MAFEINEISAIGADFNFPKEIQENSGADFSKWMAEQLNSVDQQIKTADAKLESLASGENNNLHEIMITMEKAKLSFQLALEVRNKLLESYQEVMRMQV